MFVCLQVYNEQIRDLLANAGPLAVREDSSKGVVIQGLTLHQVSKNTYQRQNVESAIFTHRVKYSLQSHHLNV